MSTAKVIFTYKRKRLSSHSGVGHEDVCAEFSLDDQVDKLQDASIKKIRRPEKDLMHACHGKKMPAACSSHALQNSSRLGEKYEVQISDTNVENKVHCSNEFPEDDTFKISGNNVSAGASLEENTSSIEKDSCLQHSSYLKEGSMQGGSVSHSVEKDSNSILKQEVLSKSEIARGQSTESSAPLLTFTRRLKRKAEACDTGMSTKLPLGEGDAAISKCDSRPALSCTCEGMSKDNRLVEKSPGIKVERSDVDMGNMLRQSPEKMTDNEIGDPSCPCGLSCAETLTLRQTEVTSNSGEDLVVDVSPVTKQTAVRTSGSIASALNHPDTINNSSLCKDDFRCPSYDGTVVSSCTVACITDEQPVSQHLRASSGDSQLTSSDSSDLKIGVAKRVEHGARSNSFDLSRPPPGAFVIDCNVVPESDVQEDASDIIQDSLMAKKNEKVMQEGHRKSKGLELFGDNSIQVEDSPDSVHTSIKTENKSDSKYLQLFSKDEKCGQLSSSNTFSENGHIKSQHSVPFSLDTQRHKFEQSTRKASDALGLSLPMELINEGQTSKDAPAIHQFQNPSVRIGNLIQNPVQSFPKQASFRHKQLLESINTRATSLRGNRNISLDKFEPCPAMWSEEELDSLWIGIRRHGRGNWHAMLLDPRLRFAPWRVAGDLEDQWEREQNRLFSGQHMPSSRYLKPQDAYKVHCHGPVIWHGTGGRRVNVTTETQLSLGDVYAQKGGVTFRSAQSYGIAQTQRHVTMASCSVGSYGCGSLNNVQASVMIGGEISPDGPAMASGMNSCLPHWLRDPFITPSRPLDPSLPPISTLPQMGGIRLVPAFPEASGTSCRGKNTINTNFAGVQPPSHSHYGTPLTRKPGMADNLIVIDSDASSEETISDNNNNVRS